MRNNENDTHRLANKRIYTDKVSAGGKPGPAPRPRRNNSAARHASGTVIRSGSEPEASRSINRPEVEASKTRSYFYSVAPGGRLQTSNNHP